MTLLPILRQFSDLENWAFLAILGRLMTGWLITEQKSILESNTAKTIFFKMGLAKITSMELKISGAMLNIV